MSKVQLSQVLNVQLSSKLIDYYNNFISVAIFATIDSCCCLTPSLSFSSHRHFHQNVKACDRSNIQNPPPSVDTVAEVRLHVSYYCYLNFTVEEVEINEINQAGNE